MITSTEPLAPNGMRRYCAFGLNIEADLYLPELAEGPTEAGESLNLVISGTFDDVDPGVRVSDIATVTVSGGQAYMAFPGVGDFQIDAEQQTIRYTARGPARELIRLPLLGPVAAVYLHLSGRLVLHASAVETAAGGLVFLGDKGAGKSTTAAAFLGGGARLLTDDLLVCRLPKHGMARCEASFAQIKLIADASEAFPLAGAQHLPIPFPSFGKIQQRLSSSFAQAGAPLRALCTLRRGDRLVLRKLTPQESLGRLMRFAYVARYGRTLLEGRSGVALFQQAANLSGRTAAYDLTLPSELAALRDAAKEAVEQIAAAQMDA